MPSTRIESRRSKGAYKSAHQTHKYTARHARLTDLKRAPACLELEHSYCCSQRVVYTVSFSSKDDTQHFWGNLHQWLMTFLLVALLLYCCLAKMQFFQIFGNTMFFCRFASYLLPNFLSHCSTDLRQIWRKCVLLPGQWWNGWKFLKNHFCTYHYVVILFQKIFLTLTVQSLYFNLTPSTLTK